MCSLPPCHMVFKVQAVLNPSCSPGLSAGAGAVPHLAAPPPPSPPPPPPPPSVGWQWGGWCCYHGSGGGRVSRCSNLYGAPLLGTSGRQKPPESPKGQVRSAGSPMLSPPHARLAGPRLMPLPTSYRAAHKITSAPTRLLPVWSPPHWCWQLLTWLMKGRGGAFPRHRGCWVKGASDRHMPDIEPCPMVMPQGHPPPPTCKVRHSIHLGLTLVSLPWNPQAGSRIRPIVARCLREDSRPLVFLTVGGRPLTSRRWQVMHGIQLLGNQTRSNTSPIRSKPRAPLPRYKMAALSFSQ